MEYESSSQSNAASCKNEKNNSEKEDKESEANPSENQENYKKSMKNFSTSEKDELNENTLHNSKATVSNTNEEKPASFSSAIQKLRPPQIQTASLFSSSNASADPPTLLPCDDDVLVAQTLPFSQMKGGYPNGFFVALLSKKFPFHLLFQPPVERHLLLLDRTPAKLVTRVPLLDAPFNLHQELTICVSFGPVDCLGRHLAIFVGHSVPVLHNIFASSAYNNITGANNPILSNLNQNNSILSLNSNLNTGTICSSTPNPSATATPHYGAQNIHNFSAPGSTSFQLPQSAPFSMLMGPSSTPAVHSLQTPGFTPLPDSHSPFPLQLSPLQQTCANPSSSVYSNHNNTLHSSPIKFNHANTVEVPLPKLPLSALLSPLPPPLHQHSPPVSFLPQGFEQTGCLQVNRSSRANFKLSLEYILEDDSTLLLHQTAKRELKSYVQALSSRSSHILAQNISKGMSPLMIPVDQHSSDHFDHDNACFSSTGFTGKNMIDCGTDASPAAVIMYSKNMNKQQNPATNPSMTPGFNNQNSPPGSPKTSNSANQLPSLVLFDEPQSLAVVSLPKTDCQDVDHKMDVGSNKQTVSQGPNLPRPSPSVLPSLFLPDSALTPHHPTAAPPPLLCLPISSLGAGLPSLEALIGFPLLPGINAATKVVPVKNASTQVLNGDFKNMNLTLAELRGPNYQPPGGSSHGIAAAHKQQAFSSPSLKHEAAPLHSPARPTSPSFQPSPVMPSRSSSKRTTNTMTVTNNAPPSSSQLQSVVNSATNSAKQTPLNPPSVPPPSPQVVPASSPAIHHSSFNPNMTTSAISRPIRATRARLIQQQQQMQHVVQNVHQFSNSTVLASGAQCTSSNLAENLNNSTVVSNSSVPSTATSTTGICSSFPSTDAKAIMVTPPPHGWTQQTASVASLPSTVTVPAPHSLIAPSNNNLNNTNMQPRFSRGGRPRKYQEPLSMSGLHRTSEGLLIPSSGISGTSALTPSVSSVGNGPTLGMLTSPQHASISSTLMVNNQHQGTHSQQTTPLGSSSNQPMTLGAAMMSSSVNPQQSTNINNPSYIHSLHQQNQYTNSISSSHNNATDVLQHQQQHQTTTSSPTLGPSSTIPAGGAWRVTPKHSPLLPPRSNDVYSLSSSNPSMSQTNMSVTANSTSHHHMTAQQPQQSSQYHSNVPLNPSAVNRPAFNQQYPTSTSPNNLQQQQPSTFALSQKMRTSYPSNQTVFPFNGNATSHHLPNNNQLIHDSNMKPLVNNKASRSSRNTNSPLSGPAVVPNSYHAHHSNFGVAHNNSSLNYHQTQNPQGAIMSSHPYHTGGFMQTASGPNMSHCGNMQLYNNIHHSANPNNPHYALNHPIHSAAANYASYHHSASQHGTPTMHSVSPPPACNTPSFEVIQKLKSQVSKLAASNAAAAAAQSQQVLNSTQLVANEVAGDNASIQPMVLSNAGESKSIEG
eukprot:GDKJ01021827.1.p1 GENE.GDKJ01021827.1~~GDKJ01021827.1.p1  ORF type:complete len:1562 (-),score=454.82 GDKJ01021827.1:76-4386(-)